MYYLQTILQYVVKYTNNFYKVNKVHMYIISPKQHAIRKFKNTLTLQNMCDERSGATIHNKGAHEELERLVQDKVLSRRDGE